MDFFFNIFNNESISEIKKVNFEDIQLIMNDKSKNYLLINTMGLNEQMCLIKNTININNEVDIINNFMNSQNLDVRIIIYDKNTNNSRAHKKYEQLIKLGFINVYIYMGGLFEWLCLQDIYGDSEFPTTMMELDILKYKSQSLFTKLLLKDTY